MADLSVDTRVALALGWTCRAYSWSRDGKWSASPPDYSTDIACAMSALSELAAKGWGHVLHNGAFPPPQDLGRWCVITSPDGHVAVGQHSDYPAAICAAILAAQDAGLLPGGE